MPEGPSPATCPSKGPPTGLTAGGDEYVSSSYATNPGSRSVSSTSLSMLLPGTPLPRSSKLFWPFLSFSPSCCAHVVICRWKGRPSHLPIPSLPWASKCPCLLGLWLRVLTSAAFSAPSCPSQLLCLPRKLQLLRQEPGRKSGLTTCWWTWMRPQASLASQRLGGPKEEKRLVHLEFSSPTFSWQPSSSGAALLREQSSLACRGSQVPVILRGIFIWSLKKPRLIVSCRRGRSTVPGSPLYPLPRSGDEDRMFQSNDKVSSVGSGTE